ncbi:MAG: hypothetical protein BroJett039_02990 [Chloroflexota bacterium]|nr:MAG: hypothetical protein BroJett039_02990 [Chloroflexota bacterium]
MRVLVLTHVFPRAAADSFGAFLLHLANAFAARARVVVIAPHAAGLADSETIEQIPVTRFHYASEAQETLAYTGVMHEQVARGVGGKILFARFVWNYLRAARAATRRFQPNVLHAHWWLPGGLVGALVSKFTRTPLVITTHGTDVEQLRRASWTKLLARFTFGQARVITCGSTYLAAQLLELGAVDEKRVRVIPMPVNPLFTQEDWRLAIGDSEFEKRKAKFKILCVARLTKQKNIGILIDALEISRARGIDAHLRIVGDGIERARLEQKTRAQNLEPFVEFLGMRAQSELPKLYAQCDAFVLPSVREGMGLVLAEALLCGAPVIAANSGGVVDIARDGETGLLFPERDANALAAALEKYARAPRFAARLAENGRALVLERFTPARVAEQFLETYEFAVR